MNAMATAATMASMMSASTLIDDVSAVTDGSNAGFAAVLGTAGIELALTRAASASAANFFAAAAASSVGTTSLPSKNGFEGSSFIK